MFEIWYWKRSQTPLCFPVNLLAQAVLLHFHTLKKWSTRNFVSFGKPSVLLLWSYLLFIGKCRSFLRGKYNICLWSLHCTLIFWYHCTSQLNIPTFVCQELLYSLLYIFLAHIVVRVPEHHASGREASRKLWDILWKFTSLLLLYKVSSFSFILWKTKTFYHPVVIHSMFLCLWLFAVNSLRKIKRTCELPLQLVIASWKMTFIFLFW